MTASKTSRTNSSKDIRAYRRTTLFLLTAAVVAVVCIAASAWPQQTAAHQTIVWTGIALIFVCVLGRVWSRLYISANKTRALTTTGPYSVCRNPLYDFSLIGAAGGAAQFGSVTIVLFVALAVWLVQFMVTRKEEQTLLAIHGAKYARYLREVPRFLPRFSRWRDSAIVSIRVRDVNRVMLDGLMFVAAIPFAALIKALQAQQILPVIFKLY